MHTPALRLATTLLALLCSTVVSAQPKSAGQDDGQVAINVDVPLEARVGDTDPTVLKMFADAGMGTPTPHRLSDDERSKLTKAFAALPPVHRRVLRERLRRISFLDGMPNTALTSVVDTETSGRAYDLTIRASVLRETVSEFLTAKERTCFDTAGSTRTVEVDAGGLDAIVYVLLHEATHMVDNARGLTPTEGEETMARPHSFTTGIWTDRLTIAPPYANPLLASLAYRRGGHPLPISQAESVYDALGRTPFVSLYGSSNWHDDVAELVAWHYLTSRMHQRYRIVIRDAGRQVRAYEPMTTPLVRDRARLLTRFYDDVLPDHRPEP